MIWMIIYIMMCVTGVAFYWDLWKELGEIEGWKGEVAQIVFFVCGGLWLVHMGTVVILYLLGWDEDEW